MRRTCSHDKTFDEPCFECELILLREAVKHSNERLERAKSQIAEIESAKLLTGESA